MTFPFTLWTEGAVFFMAGKCQDSVFLFIPLGVTVEVSSNLLRFAVVSSEQEYICIRDFICKCCFLLFNSHETWLLCARPNWNHWHLCYLLMEIKAYYSKRFLRSKDIFILIPNKKSNVKNQHAKSLTHRLHCDLILESVESKNASFLRFNCYQNADKKQLPFVTKKDIIGPLINSWIRFINERESASSYKKNY